MMIRRLRKLLRMIPPLTLALAAACAGGYSSSDQLTRRVTAYNEDVRWGRYFSASEFVDQELREEWLDHHREWRRDLRIAEYEVVDSALDGDNATVLVMVTWYRMDQSMLQTTMLAQQWERVDRQWRLSSEEIEDGTPL